MPLNAQRTSVAGPTVIDVLREGCWDDDVEKGRNSWPPGRVLTTEVTVTTPFRHAPNPQRPVEKWSQRNGHYLLLQQLAAAAAAA